MTLDAFAAFVVASAILLFMPGPTVLLVVSYAMSYGRRSAFATIGGVMLGDAIALCLSLLGLGALLRTSASLFLIMKVLGALYLVYLGVKMWCSPPILDPSKEESEPTSHWAMALDAFTVTLLNPKSGVFLIAFLPQFLDVASPILPQTLILGTTFLVLAFMSVTMYALLASEIRRLVRNPKISTAVNRVGAGVLVGAGVATAAMRRVT